MPTPSKTPVGKIVPRPNTRSGKPPAPVKRQPSTGRGIVRVSSTTADVIDRPESLEDWDDEELARGRRKDKNGRFTGRDPVVVPMNCFRELVRRQMRSAEITMAQSLSKAAEELTKIATSTYAEDRDKLKAVEMLFSRVMGKPDQSITLNGGETPLFVQVLAGGIVPGTLDEDDESDIMDAEVLDERDIEWSA